MALTTRLEMRQGQSLAMTPEMQQAIKLLKFSNQELAEYIDLEIEKNPLLSRDDANDAPAGRAANGAEGSESAPSPTREDAGADQVLNGDNLGAREAAVDVDADVVYSDDSAADRVGLDGGGLGPAFSGGRGASGRFDDEDFDLESRFASETTLREHLDAQINAAVDGPQQAFIARAIVDSLDEAGYLHEPLGQIAERLGVDDAAAEAALRVVQSLEPTGVGARSLGECLALQVAEQGRLDPAMQTLLDNLPLVAKHDIATLVRLCGVDEEDVRDMIAEVRALDPKPGLSYGGGFAPGVAPDVTVREERHGGFLVELNGETMPRVLVDGSYLARVTVGAKGNEAKTYIGECAQNANWLVRAIEQRARTILKVATEIVRQQDQFFVHGVSGLKPLTLRAVADAIGMHESTVSRVTSNKYLGCVRGVFELKFFFTTAIASADGGAAHSAEAVRHRIRGLIDAEAASNVLSDDRIVDMLRRDGIDIARRTVAKYRESMNIPSSVQRRRMKASAAPPRAGSATASAATVDSRASRA